MSKLAVVTDSTAYLPQELIQQYGIQIIPLTVIFGEEIFSDGVDLSPAAFYTRLQQSEIMPTTSQVTIGAFKELFERLHQDGCDILVITISGKLSGTVESARQAAKLLPGANIGIVDSLSTTLDQGWVVLAAARAAESGGGLVEAMRAAERARECSGVVFAVDTLEFLHRGGRIGGAKRLLGTVLNIKPILQIKDARVDTLEQARTRKKSIKRLVEIVAERVEWKSNLHLGVSHANAADDAQMLLEMACARLEPVETMIAELSPVIGTHAGPGTLALAYYYEG
jgi:DegV family protein with EDD domain